MAQPAQPLSFRPLEYWKPPKAVQHIRAKSSSFFTPAGKGARHSFSAKLDEAAELSDLEGDMSFSGKRGEQIQIEEDDTWGPAWYNVRYWGNKTWIFIAVLIAIIVAVVIAVPVVVEKNNRYPDYSKLSYTLAETYSGAGFFNDNFDYFTGYDPSSGFVHYVPEAQATSLNLTYASSSSAVLRVDTSVNASSVPNASTGRFSVRVTSKNQYGLNTLFIFDVIHSPTGCGTWPALWLADPSHWPANGEIDVMEAVNVVGDANNQMTLHTSPGCSMGVKRKETGKSLLKSCSTASNDNTGCGVDGNYTTFGSTFNSNGGAIMAMELRSAGIRMWQFPRGSIPADITSGTPDPSTWMEATADFPSTDCDIGSHFKNQSIIANIDLCGVWAGEQRIYSANCPGTCNDFVANNNTAFTDAYWEFGSFSVYNGA